MVDPADVERLARLLCKQSGMIPDRLLRRKQLGGSAGRPAWRWVADQAKTLLVERAALAEFDRHEDGDAP
jgi:hypothetical protein